MVRIGINGMGRIGRMALRAAQQREDVEVVAVNDVLPLDCLAHLLKYDSVHGRMNTEVRADGTQLRIGDRAITASAERDPARIPWLSAKVDFVLEATGSFLSEKSAGQHLQAGAKRVLLSAPPKDETPIFVYGVNSDRYRGQVITSAASCTTNCLAPIAKVLHESFGLARGLMSTVHAATATQKVVDGPSGKDWRFGRGILENIIVASTGAATAVTKVLPELEGRLTGMAFRVPVSDVSVVDLSCQLERPTDYATICSAMRTAADGELRGILGYTDEPVVSTDFRGNSCTSVFDASAGIQLDPTFFKIVSWYDNEWAFACKLLDLVAQFSRHA
jgi:glyceraldehyde 3-phosphate dehydrogenase